MSRSVQLLALPLLASCGLFGAQPAATGTVDTSPPTSGTSSTTTTPTTSYYYCFTADTPVETPAGRVPIAALEPGDLVWSVDPETRTRVARPVGRLWERTDPDGIDLEVGSRTIRTTSTHPFWVPAEGAFVEAGHLLPGDELLAFTGPRSTPARIEAVHRVERTEPVYDLTVNGPEHTFLADGLLVHNKWFGTPDLFLAQVVHAAPGLPPATFRLIDPTTAAVVDEGSVDELHLDIVASELELPEYALQIEVDGQVIHDEVHTAVPDTVTDLDFAVVHGPTGPQVLALPDFEPPFLGQHKVYAINAVDGGPDLQFAVSGLVFDQPVLSPLDSTSLVLSEPPTNRPIMVDLLPSGTQLTAVGEFPQGERSTLFATDLPPWSGEPDTLIQWPEYPGYSDLLVVLTP